MSKTIQICEVGPRDGFQSIKCAQIPTEQKIEIIEELLASGAILSFDLSSGYSGPTAVSPCCALSHRTTR